MNSKQFQRKSAILGKKFVVGRDTEVAQEDSGSCFENFKVELGRLGVLENSATRQDVRFDALSVSINELKQQARETNALLRELAQRP